jgi:phosphate starvation-inducible PhoH-like protein
MIHETLHFESHDQIRALFGCHDEYLRQIRDRIGVQVVLQGDEIRLTGEPTQVQAGLKVFSELQALIRRFGSLESSEVERILARHDGRPAQSPSPNGTSTVRAGSEGLKLEASPIDLFDRAKRVAPRTEGQKRYVEAIRDNDLIFCSGPAGCGKTYLAVAMAINALRTERVKKIVLVRPAVEAGEKLGFLPGDMLAKVNPYLRPLLDALADILSFEQVKRYLEHDIVEILPLAFMRGRTLNDTFIILDEAQNTTNTQMLMFLTRMGENSKIVVTGDPTQTDLPPSMHSGLKDAIHRLDGIPGVAVVELSGQDIVRHRLVREIVRAYDEGSTKGAPSRNR